MDLSFGEIVASAGVSLKSALAGLAGGLVRVVFMSQSTVMTAWKAVGLLMVGGLCAAYTTPLAMWTFTWVIGPTRDDARIENALSFAIGVAGMTLVEVLLGVIAALREDPGRLIPWGRGKPPGG